MAPANPDTGLSLHCTNHNPRDMDTYPVPVHPDSKGNPNPRVKVRPENHHRDGAAHKGGKRRKSPRRQLQIRRRGYAVPDGKRANTRPPPE